MGIFSTNVLICGGSLALLVIILGFVLAWRYIGYRQTLALAEKGLLPPQKTANGNGALAWGLIITALGLALCLGLWPLGYQSHLYPLGLGPWMLGGLVPLFFGLSLVLIHVLTRKGPPADQGEAKAQEDKAEDAP